MTRPSGLRAVKREPRRTDDREGETTNNIVERRVLRSKYLAIHNKINEDRDDLVQAESKNFDSLIKEVEALHHQVQKPREQVADAEALLGITSTLVSSVKSHVHEGINVSDFVSCLISKYGDQTRRRDDDSDPQVSMKWKEIGLSVSPIFRIFQGLSTMIGPMNTEIKARKQITRRKKSAAIHEATCPKEVNNSQREEKTDTDKNMATMFQILRIKKNVKLEHLILNRKSFAQTVENLFALSFLVKDGRVQIKLDEEGSHLLVPRNAPAANNVMSGEAAYTHFVFRFDFRDWKQMVNSVREGDELMPNREDGIDAEEERPCQDLETAHPRTPIRKLSRNRGYVENVDVSDTGGLPEKGVEGHRRKRKLH